MSAVAEREWRRVFKTSSVGSGFQKWSLLFCAKSRQKSIIFVIRHRHIPSEGVELCWVILHFAK